MIRIVLSVCFMELFYIVKINYIIHKNLVAASKAMNCFAQN